MRHFIKYVSLVLITAAIFYLSPNSPAAERKPYGVFCGIEPDDMELLFDYDEVIIDAAYFSTEEITMLHNNKVKVISYLNIGSLEEFRDYYSDYVDITLGEYENWPDERWVDISQKRWRDLIVHDLAKSLYKKGVDGFLLDNAGVYGQYKDDGIFEGILKLITDLKNKYGIKIILNSGFEFLDTAIERKIVLKGLIDGLNRESVITDIDFAKESFSQRPVKDTKWALDKLKVYNSYIPQIYITEYSNSKKLDKKIYSQYKKTSYKVHIARSIVLD